MLRERSFGLSESSPYPSLTLVFALLGDKFD
nr:MAG TPA: hypothetical protein [Caudoviricetes sp.]